MRYLQTKLAPAFVVLLVDANAAAAQNERAENTATVLEPVGNVVDVIGYTLEATGAPKGVSTVLGVGVGRPLSIVESATNLLAGNFEKVAGDVAQAASSVYLIPQGAARGLAVGGLQGARTGAVAGAIASEVVGLGVEKSAIVSAREIADFFVDPRSAAQIEAERLGLNPQQLAQNYNLKVPSEKDRYLREYSRELQARRSMSPEALAATIEGRSFIPRPPSTAEFQSQIAPTGGASDFESSIADAAIQVPPPPPEEGVELEAVQSSPANDNEPSYQVSPVVQRAINSVLNSACSVSQGGGDRVAISGIQVFDFTGDGHDDLIINHAGVICKNGGPSGRCADNGQCLIQIMPYRPDNNIISGGANFVGQRVEVGTGDPPRLIAIQKGKTKEIWWDGRGFNGTAWRDR